MSKRKPDRNQRRRALALTALVLLSACGSSPAVKYYLLESSAVAPDEVSAVQQRPLILLAPVRIPRYLDRSQIVTANTDKTYQLSELHRWAEGLDHNLTRVLQQDLSRLLPANLVMNASSDAAGLKLAVSILQFHVDSGGQALLEAQWQISRGNQLLTVQQQRYRQAASTSDYPRMVAALNGCLQLLTDDLAQSLRGNLPR